MLVISSNPSLISQILKVVGPLGENFGFSLPWELKFKAILMRKTQKLSFAQVKVSYVMLWIKIRYMMEKHQ